VCAATTDDVADCYRINVIPSETLPRHSCAGLWSCGSCRFRWIDPPPPLDELLAGYRETAADHWGDFGDAQAIAEPRDYAGKTAQIMQYAAGGRALDVGCFSGEFLLALPDSFDRWGIEPSRGAAQVARSRGITVVEDDALSAELEPASFDVIYCSDVFEHLVDQKALAERLSAWLAPGGVLVVETGDAMAPFARLMGARWHYYSLLEHVCFHSARSLNLLLAETGLKPVVTERRRHEQRQGALKPLMQLTKAVGFRAATLGLGAVQRLAPLPAPLRSVYERHPPTHWTRDHLWHFYARA